MGQIQDRRIREFQRRAGIVPAHGKRVETLDAMSALAVDLIKVIELEKSGIRAGDGGWGGSDPISGLIHELVVAECEDHAAWQAAQDEVGVQRIMDSDGVSYETARARLMAQRAEQRDNPF